MTRARIELKSTVAVADALPTRPLIGEEEASCEGEAFSRTGLNWIKIERTILSQTHACDRNEMPQFALTSHVCSIRLYIPGLPKLFDERITLFLSFSPQHNSQKNV